MTSRNQEKPSEVQQQVIVVGEGLPDKRTTKNLAVYSLVFGIFSILLAFIPSITLVLAIIGLIQGIVSIAQHRAGKNLAIVGIIINTIGLLLSILVGLLFILGMSYLY